MFHWTIDAFFWLVLPIAVLEALRVTRQQFKHQGRSLIHALLFGLAEVLTVGLAAATASPWFLGSLTALRVVAYVLRERRLWGRRLMTSTLICGGLLILAVVGQVHTFDQIAAAEIGRPWRLLILALLAGAPALTILPVRIADEPRETLAAPLALIAFARVALPLGAAEPLFHGVVPVLAAVLSLICALWLLSAGSRANQFVPSTLVLEILACERGVMLAFAWIGLASGSELAVVGGLFQWWSGGLALLALEGALSRRPLPKAMAFFALAMAVSLPGTIGFVAEDLLAQGLLELRPFVAAAFLAITAINAAALYLALVNLMVDLQAADLHQGGTAPQARPSFMMLSAAVLAVIVGFLPGPFVDLATHAQAAIAPGVTNPPTHTNPPPHNGGR